jgi:hypothetical protein
MWRESFVRKDSKPAVCIDSHIEPHRFISGIFVLRLFWFLFEDA